MTNIFPERHYLRLDQSTQDALTEICRHTFATKSSLMRKYVQEGIKRDTQEFVEQVAAVNRAVKLMRSV